MKIIKRGNRTGKVRITAAGEGLGSQGDDISQAIDDLAEGVGDLQEDMDEITEDDVDIELDNNIANHYIAECDGCHGIFISALAKSDQEVEKVSGVCPICDKETDQYLKWVIVSIHTP